jgi:hypothetical protein
VHRGTLGFVVICLAGVAPAGVHVSELLGSTAADDTEFIELHNPASEELDLTGWTIELWDSDAGPTFGTPDGDSPIRLRGRVDAGGFYLLANKEYARHFETEPDQAFGDNGIENSSYTLVLKDAYGEIVETIFVSDGGEGDRANVAGREIEPDAAIEAEGRFIPPGFARLPGDGERDYFLLEFSPKPAPSATPGEANKTPADE